MSKPIATPAASGTPAVKPPAPDLHICLLASGSRGNAVFISDGKTSVLFDAGLSGAELQRRMEIRGIRPDALDAIVLSHEHTDHLQAVGVLSRRFRLPVYLNKKTLKAAARRLGALHESVLFECGGPFRIDSLRVHPFSISHDAADPAGFTIQQNGKKIGLATDLGVPTAMVQHHLTGCHLLILEANHDMSMLQDGPYPWHLKQRIKSRTGHLSNDASKTLLKSLVHDGLTHVILAHLSETNNAPEIALRCVGDALTQSRAKLAVATQDRCSPLYRLR